MEIWDVREALPCIHSKFTTQAMIYPRASYKLNRAPVPIYLLDYHLFDLKNHNALSEPDLHYLFFHRFRVMCYSPLLAPSRYMKLFTCFEHIVLIIYEPAWNTATCLFMIWTGLGCLLQGINSIVWNGNMVNRAPIYCDICKSVHPLSLDRSLTLRHRTATRIQVALNVAIPACSLCINRRLCKIATAKAAMSTYSERRRAVIQDLLIGVGIPILQIVARK